MDFKGSLDSLPLFSDSYQKT